jgi:hypothetical protein
MGLNLAARAEKDPGVDGQGAAGLGAELAAAWGAAGKVWASEGVIQCEPDEIPQPRAKQVAAMMARVIPVMRRFRHDCVSLLSIVVSPCEDLDMNNPGRHNGNGRRFLYK